MGQVDDPQIVRIRLGELPLHRPRQWGACWLTGQPWEQVKLDQFWAARLPPSRKGTNVTWQSVLTRSSWLVERATNLASASPLQTIATNRTGGFGVTTFTDTSATNAGPYFYRVGVQ